jgi:nucleotide-binding universal stress UspA family protein
MYHTILVPLDGSAFAEQALPFAANIARRSSATLELVQVHGLYALKDSACSWLPYDPAEDAALKEQERAYLDAIAKRLETPSVVKVQSAVVTGMAVDGILERAHAKGAVLIVMTTHGRGPLSRAFLGSVADELIRRTPIPVLLIRPQEGALDLAREPVVRRILIPVDCSAASEQILGPAVELGRLTGASFTLLHVVQPVRTPASIPSAHVMNEQARSLPERRFEGARAYLESLADSLRTQSLTVQTRIVAGWPAAEIIREAQSQAYDLIALATHGRGGAKRLLLGSVADKAIRGCSIPTLVYRPPPSLMGS